MKANSAKLAVQRVLFLLALIALIGQIMVARNTGNVQAEAPATVNLLTNPGFEGPFSYRHDPYTGQWAGELSLPDGWDLWFDNEHVCPPDEPGCNPLSYNRRPEYKRETNPVRVRSGLASLKYFSTYGTHTAGFWQSVQVPPGSWVRFSIWAMTWSSSKDIPEHSFQSGKYGVTVGIDPTGGTDWRSAEIAWTVPITRPDEWVYLETTAYCSTGTLSVWTRGAQLYPVKHNDSYWDDATLVVLPAAPAPTPTATPTNTPLPTPQPTPTGYEPVICDDLRLWRQDDFSASLSGWGTDPATGSAGIVGGTLKLSNGPGANESFPLAWMKGVWPTVGDLRLSLRFAYSSFTGYGTSIGIGSERYTGERNLAGDPGPYGVGDIVDVNHRSTAPGVGAFTVKLFGVTVWSGTPGDTAWHTLSLDLRGRTYILSVDGIERARAVSYARPRSLMFGSTVIVWDRSAWTEVALDDVTLYRCDKRIPLPLIVKSAIWPTPTSTPPGTLPAPPTVGPSPTQTSDAPQAPTDHREAATVGREQRPNR
jgi:hypothetical protein